MAQSALSAFMALASLTLVAGQATTSAPAANPALSTFPATPLSAFTYAYSDVPEQVITQTYVRGTQSGYNRCNATTQNQNALCQTNIVNDITDWCMFAPPTPNSTIADTEGVEVSWCTKNGHGGRGIPPGTLTGVQVLKTSAYIQIVAFLNQANVNVQTGDYGGELDCGGQDGNGNPMGALTYSTAFSTNNSTLDQVFQWNQFIGGGQVAIKICNPAGTNPAGYCQHTLDRIGLVYNMPNKATNGVFEVCDSDLMVIPGEYTVNGQTSSYAQPAESLGPITTVPYTPVVPSSSNCQTYQSSAIYTDFASLLASPTGPSSAAKATGTGASNSGASAAGSSSAKPTSGSNGAGVVTISLFSSILGVAFSVAFLA